MGRTPKVLVFCLVASVALSGCGAPAPVVDVVAAEVVALEAVGYSAADAGDKSAAGGAGADAAGDAGADAEGRSPGVRPRAVRKLLRQNTLHGEVVVRGRDGAERTVVVQRGEVTAADDKGFTVTSSDGFESAWVFGEEPRVIQDREKAGRDAVRAGVKVGVGGVRDGSTVTARLIIVD